VIGCGLGRFASGLVSFAMMARAVDNKIFIIFEEWESIMWDCVGEGIFGCLAVGGYEGRLLQPEPWFLVFQTISLTLLSQGPVCKSILCPC